MDRWLLVDTGVALAVRLGVLVKLPRLRDWRAKDERVLRCWLFLWFTALAATLQIDPVYLALDQRAGINNLAWLLSYICSVLGLYFLAAMNHRTLQRAVPRRETVSVVGVITLLMGLFFPTIARSPEWVEHTLARTPTELAFMCLLYAYSLWAVVTAVQFGLHLRRQERDPLVRWRQALMLVAAGAATTWFGSKLAYVLVGWFWPTSPLAQSLPTLHQAVMAVMGLALGFSFLPSRTFERLTVPYHWLLQVRDGWELGWLQRQLVRFYPPYQNLTWLDLLLDPTDFVDQARIHVLDCRAILVSRLDQPDARRLYEALQEPALDREQDPDEIVKICRRISHQLRSSHANPTTTPHRARP